MSLVSGTIELPQDTDDFSNATIYVRLVSANIMGMPAETLAESSDSGIEYNGYPLPFSLDGTVDGDGSYNLQIHISLDGTDDVQKGDFVTKRVHPVLKENNPDRVTVKVEKV